MSRAFSMFALAVFVVLTGAVSPELARAQQQEPKITVELSEVSTIVGQPVTLRITILVPTWMSSPPVFPTFEQPNLLVRLPERATTPTSQQIDGETWSGVSRGYRLYPLAAGRFEIPAMPLRVTYAQPDGPDPVQVEELTPALTLMGTVPQGASDLNPLIVARDFTLEQTIDGDAEITAGDAITRTVTARIDGTTAILIPLLIPEMPAVQTTPRPGGENPATLRSYPKDPKVTETQDRGNLTGTRTETVSYVAQTGGTATLPELSFSWFNIESGQIETAVVAGITVTVAEPPAPPWHLDGRTVLRIGFAVAVVGFSIWIVVRFFWPWLRQKMITRRQAFEASEPYAWRQVSRAFDSRDLALLFPALDQWGKFFPDLPKETRSDLEVALSRLGQDRFGKADHPKSSNAWPKAKQLIAAERGALLRETRSQKQKNDLPPLNP